MEKTKIVITDDTQKALLRISPVDANGLRRASAILQRFLLRLIPHLEVIGYDVSVVWADDLSVAMRKGAGSFRVFTLDDLNFPWSFGKLRITNVARVGSNAVRWVITSETSDLDRLQAGEEPIACVDLGAQTGQTILEAVRVLTARRVRVERIFLGVASDRAIRTIEGAGLPVVAMMRYQRLRWLELRDLVGITGRLVEEGGCLKLYHCVDGGLATITEDTRAAGPVMDLCRGAHRSLIAAGFRLPSFNSGPV